MFCNNCGKKIEDNSKFCTYCGNKLSNLEESEKIEDGKDFTSYIHNENDKKNVTMPKWALITTIIALAVIISIASFFIFFNRQRKTVSNNLDSNLISTSSEQTSEDTTETTTEEIVETKTEETTEELINPDAENINLNIQQVDNQDFPKVRFYANISNENNETVKNLTKDNFKLFETDKDGNKISIPINELYQVSENDSINISLVLDKSGSMNEFAGQDSFKMEQAKEASLNFLKKVRFDKGYKVSITCFDDFVYLMHDFSGNLTSLSNTVNQISAIGQTALYDSIYSAILNIYSQKGAKCVIAFTDGYENASSYTFDDVVNLSKRTGVPVYLIGIGNNCDSQSLSKLAENCSGEYFSVSEDNLSNLLEKIYLNIYNDQEELYVIEYTSPIKNNEEIEREITFSARGIKGYNGSMQKTYTPKPDLNDNFGNYKNRDYIIENSSSELLDKSDLKGLSLAELRIARNEVFAKHGRLFKDNMINKWFYSKKWYLDINPKYYSEDFEKYKLADITEIEKQNLDLIREYENEILSNGEIFPDSDTNLLTEYDMYISKDKLKKALEQMKAKTNKTDTLNKNIELVENAYNTYDDY